MGQIAPIRGILFKLAHVFLVTVMLAMVKFIQGLPVTEVVFFRSFVSALAIVTFFALRGQFLETFRTERPFGHLLRAVLSVATTALTFFAVQSLPLPETVTLQYTQPLFIVILSVLLLGETVRAFRWGAVAMGFCGALIVTWPKLTLLGETGDVLSNTELLGAGAALLAAATYALNVLLVGQLVRTESSATIALWLGIYASAFMALTAPFGWVMPDAGQWVLLILIGVTGAVILMSLGESLRAAPASLTAPFEYSSLIFAAVFGFALFGDIPDANTLIGGAVLIAAGLAILWRERRIGKATIPKIPPA